MRGSNCTTVSTSGFGLGPNQFQNFTRVGVGEQIDGQLMDQWAGTFGGYSMSPPGWAQIVYCPSYIGQGTEICRMPRLVNIDEPNWVTELKQFDSIKDGVPTSAFEVPTECHQYPQRQ